MGLGSTGAPSVAQAGTPSGLGPEGTQEGAEEGAKEGTGEGAREGREGASGWVPKDQVTLEGIGGPSLRFADGKKRLVREHTNVNKSRMRNDPR